MSADPLRLDILLLLIGLEIDLFFKLEIIKKIH